MIFRLPESFAHNKIIMNDSVIAVFNLYFAFLIRQNPYDKKFLKILLGFIIPFILFGGVFASLLLIQKDIPQNYRLRIEKGQGLASVSQQLANDNVVYSKLAVRLSGKINGLDNNIRPGSYKIPSKASTWEIVQYLKINAQMPPPFAL